MVSFRSGVVAAITTLSLTGSIQAVPLAEKLNSLSFSARDILKRSTPAAPHFVAYNDKWINPFPSASTLEGFNVFAITFLLASGSVDQAQNWQELTADQRTSFIEEYNAAGISLIVSAFGSTETPTSSGVDPTSAANTMADWVIQYGVNGIDVDYEDFSAFNSQNGIAEPWLITFTQQLRTKLPQGQYILTHAPVAPWFSPSMWSGGGYLAVDKSVGSLIDWYNVQFYNQGVTEYTTCDGLLTASSSQWPQTALFQIAASGVNQDKLLIGKPGTTADANNGFIDPATLAGCVAQAAGKGWNGGVMAWQFPDVTSQWITTVRGSTFPLGGGGGSPPPTTPTPTPTASTPPVSTPHTPTTTAHTTSTPTGTGSSGGSGSCAGVSAWSSANTYTSGSKVTYNGYLWTANQWNQNEAPGGLSDAWTKNGPC